MNVFLTYDPNFVSFFRVYPLFLFSPPVLAGYAIHLLILISCAYQILFPTASGNSCTVGLVSHTLSFYPSLRRTRTGTPRERKLTKEEGGRGELTTGSEIGRKLVRGNLVTHVARFVPLVGPLPLGQNARRGLAVESRLRSRTYAHRRTA